MSVHKPGTAAMVTDLRDGTRAIALGSAEGWWQWATPRGSLAHVPDNRVSDITPLVCVEATREDADALDSLRVSLMRITSPQDHGGIETLSLLTSLVTAIREQTPEPEPPKRWTVRCEPDSAGYWLIDTERVACRVGRFARRSDAECAAEALNAAEVAS